MGRQEERTQVKTDSIHGFILQRQIPFSVFGVGFLNFFFRHVFVTVPLTSPLCNSDTAKKKEYMLPVH